MPAISANGGAERYWWHMPTGMRLVLCRNGRFLVNRGCANQWHHPREEYGLETVGRKSRCRRTHVR
jgi:phage-related protein